MRLLYKLIPHDLNSHQQAGEAPRASQTLKNDSDRADEGLERRSAEVAMRVAGALRKPKSESR